MMVNKEDLSQLPNIGKVLKDRLIEVGINTSSDLKSIGSEQAFLALRERDPEACINELLALEGAIQGIRWHVLNESRKAELKEFHKLVLLNKIKN